MEWHIWETHQVKLSKDLSKTPSPEAFLLKGLELRLSRQIGWDLSRLPKTHHAAASLAAKYFKRGVPWKVPRLEFQVSTKGGLELGGFHVTLGLVIPVQPRLDMWVLVFRS